MIKNYFKVAFRQLLKHKFYTLINVFGLAIGMACALLIGLYIIEELSYDTFHPQAEQMYRVRQKYIAAGDEYDMEDVSPALAGGIRTHLPKVAQAIRTEYPNPYTYQKNGEILDELITIRSDSNFFSFFGYRLIAGDPATVLSRPGSLVITKKVADTYFGRLIHPGIHPAMGQTLTSEGEIFTITGIAEDVPSNTHLRFEAVMSNLGSARVKGNENFWLPAGFLTYVKLQPGVASSSLKSDFVWLEKTYVWPQMQKMLGTPMATLEAQKDYLGHYLVPITDIHLVTEGYLKYVYIFGGIGVVLLAIACINFINLTTARAAARVREVGVRKALGTSRRKLIGQFMMESALFTLLAMIIAMGLAEILRIPFNSLSGKELHLNVFQDVWIPFFILLAAGGVSVAAGLYPAFYLSSFKPADALKGKNKQTRESSRLRNGLVVFQFCISSMLIICATLIYQQFQFLKNKAVGFSKENVILLPNAYTLDHNKEAFRQELLQQTDIISVSFSTTAPGDAFDAFTTYRLIGGEEKYQAKWLGVDTSFMSTFHVRMLEGRNITIDTTAITEVLLNESAARQLGTEPIIGSIIRDFRDEKLKIVGVVEDFNFEHLRYKIMPLIVRPVPDDWFYYTAIRIQPGDIASTLQKIEGIWKKHNQQAIFNYSFLDDKFNTLFKTEQRLSQVVAVLTGITIFVACMGLLGLVAYTAEQRTREIGIRKVMGASVKDIVVLLSGSFTRLIMLAFLFAVPLSYYLINEWLQAFAYRISISAGIFVVSGVGILWMAWLTIGYQSIKAALANPVEALRDE